MRSSFAILAMAVSAVSSQSSIPTYGSSLNMTIDPNSVDFALRSDWCGAQQNTCDTLCSDDTSANECTEEDLEYECTCASNNSAPGLQYYTQTMPTFICQTLFAQCIEQNTGSARDQRECTSKIDDLCAEQAPPRNLSSDDDSDDDDATSTASDTTATATESADATDTAESVSSSTSDGLAAPTMAPAGKGAAAALALGMLAYLV
ncbi:hypothetical protein F66182_714 [Fusarium sp. NRRL 66182]|nr:hypothetical protein F66182_714 [Fusarium sp. NRRL 66182]